VGKTAGLETLEFKHEFLAETDRLLRARLLGFATIWMSLNLFLLVAMLVGGTWAKIAQAAAGDNPLGVFEAMTQVVSSAVGPGWKSVVFVLLTAVWFGFYCSVIWQVWQVKPSARRIVQLSIALIVADGMYGISARVAGLGSGGLFAFWLAHLVACCIFPWTVRQAIIPIAIVVTLSTASKLTIEGKSLSTFFVTGAMLLCMTPAVGICWYRHSLRVQKSSHNFLRQRYGMLRQELAYARQIHEAVFPSPKSEGPVCFAYRYQPMRQIGGDFLHVHIQEAPGGHECVSVVVMDVTGHGIPAALSVNRLHGEIELRFADNPDISPGEMLSRLNRYVYLTMAKHSLFVTALCVRIDTARGEVTWASGGHPPAFLRGVDGTVRELGSTAFVLGACSEEDFDAEQQSCAFGPGDSLVAYTDGASEARNPSGKMLRIIGLRSMVAAEGRVPGGAWPERILGMVSAHRGGLPTEDDLLVIEIYRPVTPGAARRSAPAGSSGAEREPEGAVSP